MRRVSHSTSAVDRLGLIAVAALDALCYPLILAGASSAPHLTFAALRALIAGLVLAAVAVHLGRPIPREPRTWAYLALIGVGTISFGYLGMFRGAEFVSPGMATTITHVQPFIAALLAYPILAERPTSRQLVGLMLGFGGVLVIAIPPWIGGRSSDFPLGFFYLVIAATGVATGNVLTRKVAGNVDPIVATSAQCLFGFVPLSAAAVLVEDPLAVAWSCSFIGSLLGLALVGTALARCLWFTLLSRVALHEGNAFTFLTPFIALGYGAVFFGEAIETSTIFGLLVAALGILLVELGGARQRK
jgi:drug/metabolite transporter (DMT)-like permease